MSKPIYGDTVGGGGGSLKKIPQADWGQTDDTQLDYIKNKPDIYTRPETDALFDAVYQTTSTQQEAIDTNTTDISSIKSDLYNVIETTEEHTWLIDNNYMEIRALAEEIYVVDEILESVAEGGAF